MRIERCNCREIMIRCDICGDPTLTVRHEMYHINDLHVCDFCFEQIAFELMRRCEPEILSEIIEKRMLSSRKAT